MEVARMDGASGHGCTGPGGKRYVIKPRSHSDMEADPPNRNRKSEFPVGSRTPTMSRFGLKKYQKSSISSTSVTSRPMLKSSSSTSRNSGSVVHMPLPPPPPVVTAALSTPALQLLKSPQRFTQAKRKPGDNQGHLNHPLLQQQNHHQQPHHHQHRVLHRQSNVTVSASAPFSTNFSRLIGLAPPGFPDGFLRPTNTFGKVKVILKISPTDTGQQSCLSVDPFKRHVTLVDLLSGSLSSGAVSALQRPPHAPKMFQYDSIITEAEPQMSSCMAALPEAIHAVVGGLDGCVLSYGHARLGKTLAMIGTDESTASVGLIPTAICWLFRLIADRRKQTGMKYTVRVSAIEVTGRQEETRDLLAGDGEGHMTLKDDPISGTELLNLCELKAMTAEQACHHLDLALSYRHGGESRESRKNCHFIFILHIYQNHVPSAPDEEYNNNTTHSRLYLMDFGTCSKSTREGPTLSLSALGMLILALLNGQRHIPYRESRLAQILKSVIGSSGCHSTVLVHVTGNPYLYNETLQVLQLTSRMNKLKIRKRSKAVSSTSSDDASNSRAYKHRKGVKMGTLRDANLFYSSGHEGGVYSSGSSDVSADTTVFTGFESDSRCSFNARSGPPSASGSCVTLDPVFESCYESLQRFGGSSSGVSKLHHYDNHYRHHHDVNNRSAPSSTVSAPAYSQRRVLAERSNADEVRYHRHQRRGYREAPFSPSKEMWIDGPNADYLRHNSTESKSSLNQAQIGRQTGSNGSVSNTAAGSSRGFGGPASKERYEQWVDGPPEFQTLTRANVSVQKISYSKIVKVASLRDSTNLLEEAKPTPSDVTTGIEEFRLLGGMAPPLHQSTPNSTLTRRMPKVLPQSVREQMKRKESSDASLLEEKSTSAILSSEESGRASSAKKSHGSLERDRLFLNSSGETRGQGDGKEILITAVEMDDCYHGSSFSSAPASNSVYSGITMCSTDGLNLSLISSLENTRDDDDDNEDDDARRGGRSLPAMLMTNRESIYELQMDKDLEFESGTESLRKLACLSDDEAATLWTVSSESTSSNRKAPFGVGNDSRSSGEGHHLDSKVNENKEDFTVSDLATVWMEQDFTVETFYVPAGVKTTGATVQYSALRPPLPTANLHATGYLQRFNSPPPIDKTTPQHPINNNNNNTNNSNNNNSNNVFYNSSKDRHFQKGDALTCTPVTSPNQSESSDRVYHCLSVDGELVGGSWTHGDSEGDSNPEMVQSIHSQISNGLSKQAKISKVPKLQSLSPRKSPVESATSRGSKIPFSPTTHASIYPSTPLSPSSSSMVSNSSSFSSITTTASGESGLNDRSSTKDQLSSSKTKPPRSGQSFLQRLRTPLFFRCKNSTEKSETTQKCKIPTAATSPTSPLKEEKVGKLVSKVKLLTKDGKSSQTNNQKTRKDEIKLISPTTNGLKSKLKPIHVTKNSEPSTYETRLSPIQQSFHPIGDGHQMNRPDLEKLDLDSNLLAANHSVPSSAPSPVIDHTYHSSVMQLMSPDASSDQAMDTCSGNSRTKLACDENSVTTMGFENESVFEEISHSPSEILKRFSKKERSQSEPYHSGEPTIHAIPRDSKSADLLNGVKVKRSQQVTKALKQNKVAASECRNEEKKSFKKSEIPSLNETFVDRSKTTNCFEVTCLAKNKQH